MTDLLTPETELGVDRPPDFAITVYGAPAPQGSKKHMGNGVMREMSEKLKPWRTDVKAAAIAEAALTPDWAPLDGPLAVSMVFTMRDQPASKPTWWPLDVKWSRSMRWRPASMPDLSKLLRSTEDALTGVAWKDDARVVEYLRAAKYYVGHDAPDVLPHTTGAVIRIWKLS